MAYEGVPTVRKRLLGYHLRQLREAEGLKWEDTAARLQVAKPTVMRQESGHSAVSSANLEVLLDFYKVGDLDKRSRLEAFRQHGRKRGTWHAFGTEIGPTLRDLADAESIATSILWWELGVIPGILQTDEYAEATLRGASVQATNDETLRELAHLRRERRHTLEKDGAPEAWFILGEAALRTRTGGPGKAVMETQIRYLLDISEQPHVNIQVVPFAAGAHPGVAGSFTLLGSTRS